MATSHDLEGHSTFKPFLFDDTNYICLLKHRIKKRIKILHKVLDTDLWEIIESKAPICVKYEGGKRVPKSKSERSNIEKKKDNVHVKIIT